MLLSYNLHFFARRETFKNLFQMSYSPFWNIKAIFAMSDEQFSINIIAKDYLLTLVKSRLALGSPGCSVGRHHAEND